ncbi:hypothetical protein H6F78_00025 [Coleofasciculus sp. FACHB-64]|uniref:hypothetical protein n=1 Tax=Cyanophyceae TaxID=3028117 RepID=UPI00168504A3|nr:MULTISPECIES: hypothetical protein [unclassified Coleofasciculus]MBD1836618.1 hypothetical protein [Coleofasciculus sp. FACHB-501]MBD1903730.1 hypothetical protein [Coleofasciculus sp. FACHB-125]MBD2044034.1 hypothetical protein [Coleofasciculus sp. FACHB-64]
MGRKAKLKKIRQLTQPSPQSETNSDPNEFVERLEKQGYQLERVERCPEVPNHRVEPQM